MKKQVCKHTTIIFTFLFSICTANAAFEKHEDPQRKIGIFQSMARIEPPGGETGDPDGPETGGAPVGDALPALIGLGLIYGVYIFKRRKEEI